jgi:GDP/UDP-N,N'-diacetylbacillosamine 2-epimerase (hydrolysing)
MTTLLATATRKIPRSGKRRICFPITSRAYYGRSQLLIRKLHAHDEIELDLMLGGSILLDKYSRQIADDIEAGGFTISGSFLNVIEGGNHVAMAKTACLTALEFTNGLHTIAPDIVIICGDRFEQLAIAMAAAYLNTTIAHIEGGDLTGSIDESVRHAITKLAHLHFVTNADAGRRVVAMGEDPRYVYNTGSLDVEVAARVETVVTSAQINAYGVGHTMDLSHPFLMVMQHPVTTERDNREHIQETLHAVAAAGLPAIWFWPNADAGTDEMAGSLRHMREEHGELTRQIRFITNVPVDEFVSLLRQTACLVGNSSAGIKECSFLGTPVVNIGARQQGRMASAHASNVGYRRDEIAQAIAYQVAHGRYAPSTIYYQPDTSDQILHILASAELYTQKRFYDPPPAPVRSTEDAENTERQVGPAR